MSREQRPEYDVLLRRVEELAESWPTTENSTVADQPDLAAAAHHAVEDDLSVPPDDDIALPPGPDAVPSRAEAREVPDVPAIEMEQVRAVFEWCLRRAGGGVFQMRSPRVPVGAVWQHLEAARSEPDLFESLYGVRAPDWFTRIARRALLSIPRVPSPNPRARVAVDKAGGGNLLRTLVAVDPLAAGERLERAAADEHIRPLGLASHGGLRGGVRLLEALENGEKLLAHLTELGISEGDTAHVVMSALSTYPGTTDWTASLEDEMAAVIASSGSRDAVRGTRALRQQQSVGLILAIEQPAIFAAIPAALDYYLHRFRGTPGKLIDVHYPTRVLHFLRDRWRDRSPDPQADFAPYLDATPTHGMPKESMVKLAQERFYTNYGYLALGGITREQLEQRNGHLFRDLIERDLLPRNEQDVAIVPAEVTDRAAQFQREVRRKLEMQSLAVAEDYRFLAEAAKPEVQLRMIGTYLATLPFRQHLLGSGPLSIWESRALSPRFAKLIEAAYRDAAPEPNAPVALFSAKDRERIRETTALRLLMEDDRLAEVAPVIVWLRSQGEQLLSYDAACSESDRKNGLPEGTTRGRDRALLEQLEVLPHNVQANSVASFALGLSRPNGADAVVMTEDFGSPPDTASLLLSVAMNVAVGSEQGSRYLSDPEIVAGLERLPSELDRLGKNWTGSKEDWRQFGALLMQPAFATPLADLERAEFSKRVIEAIGIEGLERLPQMHFSAEARGQLATILQMPAAPVLLRGRMEVEPAKILLAAAVLHQNQETDEVTAPYWRGMVNAFKEQVRMLGEVDVVPAPERDANGIYRRPRRGAKVRVADLENVTQLTEIATRVNGLVAGDPLRLPDLPTTERNWESPETWTNAGKSLGRNTAMITRLFGANVQIRDLPRILEHGATLAEKHDVLLRHASEIAGRLFEQDGAHSSRSMSDLLERTRGLLLETRNASVAETARVSAATISAVKPREVAAALQGPPIELGP